MSDDIGKIKSKLEAEERTRKKGNGVKHKFLSDRMSSKSMRKGQKRKPVVKPIPVGVRVLRGALSFIGKFVPLVSVAEKSLVSESERNIAILQAKQYLEDLNTVIKRSKSDLFCENMTNQIEFLEYHSKELYMHFKPLTSDLPNGIVAVMCREYERTGVWPAFYDDSDYGLKAIYSGISLKDLPHWKKEYDFDEYCKIVLSRDFYDEVLTNRSEFNVGKTIYRAVTEALLPVRRG